MTCLTLDSIVQSQNTVSAYFKSKQILPFGFARQSYCLLHYNGNLLPFPFITVFGLKKVMLTSQMAGFKADNRQIWEGNPKFNQQRSLSYVINNGPDYDVIISAPRCDVIVLATAPCGADNKALSGGDFKRYCSS